MNHDVDLKNYQIRTDLALESLKNSSIDEIQNVVEEKDGIIVTTTYLDSVNGKKIGRKEGTYVTIEFDDVTDHENLNCVKKVFSEKLEFLLKELKVKSDDMGLIIGLGNDKSTPD